MRRRKLIATALVAVSLATCADTRPKRGAFRGTVRMDGQPLASGNIRIFPLTSGVGTDGDIQDGQYSVPPERGPTTGKYHVEFVSFKKTGRRVPDPDGAPGEMKDEIVDTIPFKYNRHSTIQIDYDATIDKAYDFDLKSK